MMNGAEVPIYKEFGKIIHENRIHWLWIELGKVCIYVVFRQSGKPEVCDFGMYWSYRDSTHTFHIWYGGSLTY